MHADVVCGSLLGTERVVHSWILKNVVQVLVILNVLQLIGNEECLHA